jgi:hypothetical protein
MACRDELSSLLKRGQQKDISQWGQSFTDLNQWLDVPHYTALEEKYTSD